MSANSESSVLKEQFIPDTIFLLVAKGAIQTYDGNKKSIFKTGDVVKPKRTGLPNMN